MDKLESHIVDLKSDLKYIIKVLDGNGDKGLIGKVAENTAWRNRSIGAIGIVGAIGIGNILVTLSQ